MQIVLKDEWFKVLNKIVDEIYSKNEVSSEKGPFDDIDKKIMFMALVELTRRDEQLLKDDFEKGLMPCLVYMQSILTEHFIDFFISVYNTIGKALKQNKNENAGIYASILNRMKIIITLFTLVNDAWPWNGQDAQDLLKNLCLFDIDNEIREENESLQLEKVKLH